MVAPRLLVEKNAPVKIEGRLVTKTAIAMMKLLGRRKEHGRERAVQLPEGGFEHPFWDSADRPTGYQGKEQPRTVGAGSSRVVASFRHNSTRSSSCGCVHSLII